MPYSPFYEYFPDLAGKETRTLTTIDHPLLPPDDYALIELYCDEPGCDCRRVMFNIYCDSTNTLAAVIAYGWESREFYVRWFGEDVPHVIRELLGPTLNVGSPQSPLAPALLATMKVILSDTRYVDRLKRHYALFKRAVESKAIEPTRRTQVGRPAKKRLKRPKSTKIKKSRRQKKKK